MRLGDEEYKGFIDLLMDIDWTGYDAWLVGGITGDWDTPDIDLIFLGPYDPERIKDIQLQARVLGPFDICYSQDDRVTRWTYGDPPIRLQFGRTYSKTNVRALRKIRWSMAR